MQLIDVHTHLETPLFDPIIDTVMTEAREAGLVKIITSSVKSDEWHRSRNLAKRFKEIEYTPGIHPWFVTSENAETVATLYDEVKHGAVGIGEIGLDKMVEEPPLALQISFFEEQLAIACELNLPVVIHCRKAYNQLYHSLKRVGVPVAGGIIHSFTGSRELAKDLISFGLNFSLGGILTYHNSTKREKMLNYIYPDHFMLETDSPEIVPIVSEEEGGPLERPSLPKHIIYNLQAAAHILDVTPEEVAKVTTDNAKRLFNF